MAGRAELKLYDGQEKEIKPASPLEVLPAKLQSFHDSTGFDLGSIVELHYHRQHSNFGNSGANYSVGYVVKSGKHGHELIKLSKELPEKRFFNATMSLLKSRISEFRLLALPDSEAKYFSFTGSLPPEKFYLGAIIELLEDETGRHEHSQGKRKMGYITRIGSDSLGISMDHPSNLQGSFSVKNMMEIPLSMIRNYRVLGQRDLF